MGKIKKSKRYLFLTLTFLLLIANCVSINLIPQNEIILTCECPDFSDNCEHSHNQSLEDDVLYVEKTINLCKLEIHKNLLSFSNSNFKNIFISQIWQPPKNS